MTRSANRSVPAVRATVCVIGSGPAGALVADRLAQRGHDVVVLEAGPRFGADETGTGAASDGGTAGSRRTDRLERMERHVRPSFDIPAVWDVGGARDAYSSTGAEHYPLNTTRVKGVGGTSLHWQGMVMRLHEADFERRSRDGVGVDWPISYADLAPYYARTERELGVAGALDNPFAPPRDEPFPLPAFPPSYSDSLFADACERLGVVTHSVPNARTSEPYRGRGPCEGYGTCKPVCPSGARYAADRHVRRAESNGAHVVDRAPVQRLETDPGGDRVTRAVYVDERAGGNGAGAGSDGAGAGSDGAGAGTERAVEADRFVLCAGGVETPRLLLLSANDAHPDGLANRSDAVGRYFMDHVFVGAGGRVDRATRQKHVGFNTTECHQFYDDPGRATEGRDGDGIPGSDADLGPIKLEFTNYAGPSPVTIALESDAWGDELLDEIRSRYGRHIAMGGLVGQLPRAENRVTLDRSRTDDHGNPVPDVQWSVDDRTRRTAERATDIQREILEALGADVEWTADADDPGPAAHHVGTTRMGTDPTESVVRPDLRTHDVNNLWIASSSVFPTSGAMNPTLTIAALALRCADAVARTL